MDNFFSKKVPIYHNQKNKCFQLYQSAVLAIKIMRTDEYAFIKMEVNKIIQKPPVKISILTEMYLVNSFKTNLLIGSDIFNFQRVIINYDRETTVFGSCQNFIIFIEIRTGVFFNTKRTIKIKSFTIIPPSITIQVPVIYKIIPNDRMFLFEPECQQNLNVRKKKRCGGSNSDVHKLDSSYIQEG